MRNQKWLIPLIVVALLAAIILPIVFSSYSRIKEADNAYKAKNYKTAEYLYKSAAQFLPWRGDLLEKAGISAGAGGDYSEAINLLLKVPHLTQQGWATLGLCYFNTGKLDLSLKAYRNGLDNYGPSTSLYSGIALVYRVQNDWTDERIALEEQVSLDAGDVQAHYRLGLLLTVLDSEKAITELMLASSLDPQFDPAVQTLRTALNLSATQPDSSQQMVTIGRALGLVNEWVLAESAFEKAISLHAENAEAWAWLGEAKQQLGQDGRAELDKALMLDGQSVIVHALRGLYWNRQKKYSQALAEYVLAAAVEPENPAWQASKGDAYTKLGDLVSALTAYQHATALAPNEATYWRLLAVFCAENGVHVEDVGLPAAQKAVELAPDDITVLDALGQSYLSSGRPFTAEKTFLDVIKRAPDFVPAHLHLAMTYLFQANRADAYNELVYVRNADPSGDTGKLAEQLLKQYFP